MYARCAAALNPPKCVPRTCTETGERLFRFGDQGEPEPGEALHRRPDSKALIPVCLLGRHLFDHHKGTTCSPATGQLQAEKPFRTSGSTKCKPHLHLTACAKPIRSIGNCRTLLP